MRPFDLDRALAAWRRAYRFNPAFSERDLDELELHIRDHIQHLIAAGHEPEDAFHEALRELGDYRTADHEYRKVIWGKWLRLPADYFQPTLDMLKNYIVLAYRTMRRNTLATTINLTGLSLAIGIAVVCFVFIDRWVDVEAFHENAARIFVVGNTVDRDGEVQKWVSSPLPLGPALQADLPQVEQAVRFMRFGTDLRVTSPEGTVLQDDENVVLVDPAFLEVFTYPLLEGETTALYDPNAVVLTREIASKYFGNRPAVGEPMEVLLRNGESAIYTVRGIIDRRPLQSSIPFDVLLPFDTYGQLTRDPDFASDWQRAVTGTFLLLDEAASVHTIADQMVPYLARHNAVNNEWVYTAFTFDNLRTMARIANEVRGEIAQGPPLAVFFLFGGICVMLLILACFNYVNVTLAATTRRLKEIGVRKTMGGQRRQIVVQFLTENTVLCALALGVGVLLAQAFFLPLFNSLTRSSLAIDYAGSGTLWLFMALLLVGVAVASGSYPAFYVARFKPIDILRGKRVLSPTSGLLRGLLTVQFVVAFLAMFAGVAFVQNAKYQQQQGWGFDKAHVLSIPLNEASQYGPLAERLSQDANVTHVAGTRHRVGENWGWATLEVDGLQMESVRFDVGANYVQTMGLILKEGQTLDPVAPIARAVLVNETLVQAREWTAPIGQTFRFDGEVYTVAGVVQDFNYISPNHRVRPGFIRIADPEAYDALVVRVQEGTAVATYEAATQIWDDMYPDKAFEGYFQSEVFDRYFQNNRRTIQVFTLSAGLALFLSIMGLFGLAAQHMARRRHEVGIRKVLGADLRHVIVLVNRGFFFMIAGAFMLALPIGYIGLDTLLGSFYAMRMPISLGSFVLAFVVVSAAAVAAVGIHFHGLAKANPADVLRAN
ncbi:MAG: ABC transporter permease [Rhodothermales bacterium]